MRRRHKLQVSTFPFLAVLLCTMGSLILVLLVMDRKARHAAQARAAQKAAQREEESAKAEAEDAAERHKKQQEKLQAWEQKKKDLHVKLLTEEQMVQLQMKRVRDQLAEALARLRAEQEGVVALQGKSRSERDRLALAARSLAELRAAAVQAGAKAVDAHSAQARMTEDVMQLEQTLKELKAARKRESQTFSVIPYHGRRGESRRPLYVECTSANVIFHPGHVGLDPIVNTVAVRAQVRQRIEHQRARYPNDPSVRRPYLLLLVRPDGMVNYYRFQSILADFQVDFGYEFIDPDWVLDFPEDEEHPRAQPWMTVTTPRPQPTPAAQGQRPPATGIPRPHPIWTGSRGGAWDGRSAAQNSAANPGKPPMALIGATGRPPDPHGTGIPGIGNARAELLTPGLTQARSASAGANTQARSASAGSLSPGVGTARSGPGGFPIVGGSASGAGGVGGSALPGAGPGGLSPSGPPGFGVPGGGSEPGPGIDVPSSASARASGPPGPGSGASGTGESPFSTGQTGVPGIGGTGDPGGTGGPFPGAPGMGLAPNASILGLGGPGLGSQSAFASVPGGGLGSGGGAPGSALSGPGSALAGGPGIGSGFASDVGNAGGLPMFGPPGGGDGGAGADLMPPTALGMKTGTGTGASPGLPGIPGIGPGTGAPGASGNGPGPGSGAPAATGNGPAGPGPGVPQLPPSPWNDVASGTGTGTPGQSSASGPGGVPLPGINARPPGQGATGSGSPGSGGSGPGDGSGPPGDPQGAAEPSENGNPEDAQKRRRAPYAMQRGGSRRGSSSDEGVNEPFAPVLPPSADEAPAPRPKALIPFEFHGNRDWPIYLECREDGVVLYPSRKLYPLSVLTPAPNNPLLLALAQMIQHRQALVLAGETPYRPQIFFLVRPGGLRTCHLAYPALASLPVVKKERDVQPDEDVQSIITER